MIDKYLPIDHKTFELMFHEIIKNEGKQPKQILTTVVPSTWKPPAQLIEQLKKQIFPFNSI